MNAVGPAAALVVMARELNVPLPIALGLSLLLFGGLYLVLNPRTETEEGRRQLRAEARAQLDACRVAVARLRGLAAETDRVRVGERVGRICDRAEPVIATLAGRDLSLASATQLAGVFEVAARTLDTYVRVAGEAGSRMPQELRTIVEAVEAEGRLFDQLESELNEWAASVVRDDLVEIEAAIRTLERTLKIQGLS